MNIIRGANSVLVTTRSAFAFARSPRTVLPFVLALALGAGARAAGAEPIALTVDASAAPRTSIVHVRESFPVAAAGTFDVAYPRWVPGEHGPNGPVQNVADIVATAGGRTLAVERDLADLNEFHIAVPAGASHVEVDFDYLGSKDGTYGESRLATQTILALNWNQVLLYPARADIATTVIAPTLVLPGADWSVGTALPGPARIGNRVAFAPATLERLVDSPLDAGTAFKRFPLLDSNGYSAEIDAFADRTDQLDLPAASLAGMAAMVGEMDAIYGARHWRNYHFLLTVSDVMPGNGVEHGSSSDDGTDGDGLTDPDGITMTAGLLAHEFNHSWDGKYRRPADLATSNFQVPEQTELLWIYEGMTQLYGDLVPARAGLMKPDLFRERIAATYAREDNEPGRQVRPLADTAAAAPFLYQAPRSLSAERRAAGDFYAEGELLWLDVEARLDALSHGTKSLDGFCRSFFGLANTPAEVNPYTYEQFLAALESYAPGGDWRAYFASRVYRVTPHPPDPFEALGWRVAYTNEPNAAEAIRLKANKGIAALTSLGIVGNEKGTLSDVITGSPGAKAGLAYDDTIVAVDARDFTPEVLMKRIAASAKSTAPIVLIVKHNGLYRTVTVDYHGGARNPHLVRIANVPDRLTPFLAAHRAATAQATP